MSTGLLVVEPNETVRDQLREQLHKSQLAMSVLYSTAQLLDRVERECPCAILLRAETPMAQERDALRQLRGMGYDMPVFVISESDDVVDKIVMFELGADDYFVAPADSREIIARVKRALQRSNHALHDAPELRAKVSFGNYQLDFATRRLIKAGTEVPLRSSEFALLRIFAANPMRLLTRSMVNSQLGKSTSQYNSLDVAVFRLRSIIEDDPGNPKFVQTIRGRGFVFVPSPVVTGNDASLQAAAPSFVDSNVAHARQARPAGTRPVLAATPVG